MSKLLSISLSRKQLILISWLCDSNLDFLSSFSNFGSVDVIELKDLKDTIDSIIKFSFK